MTMTFDSIKSRLALMTCICVFGMGLMVASQLYFTQRLVTINQQQDLLLRLGQDLLQMRRHEKDFLLRHQPDYFEQFNQRAARFSLRLQQLSPLFAHYALPKTQAGELAQSLQTYQQLFQQVVALQTQIGLKATEGLVGQLTEVEAKLLRSSTFEQGQSARVSLDEIRLTIRNFLLSQDTFYSSKAAQAITDLQATVGNRADLEAQMAQYKMTFLALVDAHERLGLTHNDGLRGKFRRQAHNVEALLKRIDADLQPIINTQQRNVRIYSIAIAVLTSIALVLLLIKSFATFQKAFGNFVMFFYRCKRQYQKIDPRTLGFAEFKSLAQLANEMVESRKNIEQRLAAAEAQLQASKPAD